MSIYRVSASESDPDNNVTAQFQFYKLNHVVYNAHHRDVYVAAKNEEEAKKKGLVLIKKATEEDIDDESR